MGFKRIFSINILNLMLGLFFLEWALHIAFNPVDMFISIFQIVIIPIVSGLFLNYKFPAFCDELKEYLPGFSSIVICLIVAGVIGANKEAI